MPRPHYRQPAGVALHLVQRARIACFPGERDRLAYLCWLRGFAERCGTTVHAYALMGNHVHVLLTPRRASGAAELMQAVNSRYARHLDETYAVDGGVPPGRLWEEGCDASPIHARQYLLGCMRYIETNPVRARVVARPGDYRWSSYRANALGRQDALVTPHPLYYALGRTPEARQAAYRASFRAPARASARAAPCILRAGT